MRSDEGPASPREEIPDWEAIARFLAGEGGVEESRAVAAWLDAHPADAALVRSVHAMGQVAFGAEPQPAGVDVEAALARVKARFGGGEESRVERSTAIPLRAGKPATHVASRDDQQAGRFAPRGGQMGAPPRSRAWMGWSGAGLAAAAALLLFVRTDRGRDATPPAASAPMALTTAAGARDSVRLPDGTHVLLGPASRLTWDARDPRVVTLEGVARFVVVHDAAHPFTVRAGDAVVRDVGTAFVVRAEGGADAGAIARVAVAVSEGAVSLATRATRDTLAANDGVTLHAGDRGELVAGSTVVQRGALAAADTAWTSGRLVYDGTRLELVIGDVARWYGVELRLADSALQARRLTASFDAADPPARVIDAVALALGATVTREAGGRVAVLHPGR